MGAGGEGYLEEDTSDALETVSLPELVLCVKHVANSSGGGIWRRVVFRVIIIIDKRSAPD